ncbi:type II toxin-antitoxin system HicB family antitoxin [Desulfonatronum sp. SC1]|uniref:type II toxin-antitoxin system HicB family antitoxin n=1 Tax=Desulfonatronum sp. SC1 TaxID=2109626 RepID=UPI0013048863|nr:hypothetical protein [Desulfonatronum sp. SC1]
MQTLEYKNYMARVDFDARDNILVGRITEIEDMVSFHASTTEELNVAFVEAVEDYLSTCKAMGKPPSRTMSDKVTI